VDGFGYVNLGSGGTDNAVYSLSSTGTRLYAGGALRSAGGVSAGLVAYWDGAWHGMTGGRGPNTEVDAVHPFHGEAHVGGPFLIFGGEPVIGSWVKYSENGRPWVAHQPSSATVNPGGNVTFSTDPATGYDNLTFQWQRNGVPLADGPSPGGSMVSGSATQALTISNVSAYDIATYRMVLSNSCGNDTSTAVTLDLIGTTDVPLTGVGDPRFESVGPNPTPGSANLAFTLSREAMVSARIHDVAGRAVRRLDAGRLGVGRHRMRWDGRNENGEPAGIGLYFVGLEVDTRTIEVKRLTIAR
jgi:hypothetical protein